MKVKTGKGVKIPWSVRAKGLLSELWAPSNCYQVQVQVRRNADRHRHRLLGVLRVKGHASCALDGSPGCERVLSKR